MKALLEAPEIDVNMKDGWNNTALIHAAFQVREEGRGGERRGEKGREGERRERRGERRGEKGREEEEEDGEEEGDDEATPGSLSGAAPADTPASMNGLRIWNPAFIADAGSCTCGNSTSPPSFSTKTLISANMGVFTVPKSVSPFLSMPRLMFHS